MRLFLALLFLGISAPLLAQDVPPLPRERPAEETAQPADATAPADEAVEPTGVPLPRRRPAPPAADPEEIEQDPATKEPENAEPQQPPEPPRVFQSACPAVIAGLVEAEMLPPIAEGDCVERSPLSVTGVVVNGRMVPLSSPATLSCGMATALPDWASDVDGYLFSRENARLEMLITGTSYSCRNVNNGEGGRLSEHAFANALDVVGFGLDDGRSATLPGGWADPLAFEGRALRYAHDAACSRFTTTLGPEANALHHDHLHVDMGCHGQRCTARMCE